MPLGVIIPAAGRGDRLGANQSKALVSLVGEPLLAHTCRALLQFPPVAAWVVLAPEEDGAAVEAAARLGLGPDVPLTVTRGGATRAASVRAGLAALPAECDLVAVHDAARPCVSRDELCAVVAAAESTGAAILARPCTDTVKQSDDGRTIAATLDRTGLWFAQTPQVFRTALLREALDAAPQVTDEAAAVEQLGVAVQLVPGRAENLKVTTPADLAIAAALLEAAEPPCASDSVSTNIDSSPTAV